MSDLQSRLANLYRELVRRRVVRVAAAYAVAGWVVVEVTATVAPLLYLPAWVPTLVVVLVLLGFPAVVGLTWVFDLTPAGVVRTDVAPEGSPTGRMAEEAGPGPLPGRTRLPLVAGGLLLLVVAVGAAVLLAPRNDAMTVANRVAVLPFENQSGDPDLDDLGVVAADWIADGLTTIDSVQVVPTSGVLQALRSAGPDADPLPRIAAQTRAGLVVTGSVLTSGDSVVFRAQMTDPTAGEVVASFATTRGARSEPTAALTPLRQQVMGAVATRFGPPAGARGERPPTYEAYRAYISGRQLYSLGRYPEAIQEYGRAWLADTTYGAPVFATALAYGSMGDWARMDTVLRLITPYRARVSDLSRLYFDWAGAWLQGDLTAAYRFARQAYDRAPASDSRFIAASFAYRANRPAEAVALLEEEPPDSEYRRTWLAFHSRRASALHVLGEHREELEAAREARRLFVDQPAPYFLEARALAGLGRVDDAEAAAAGLLLAAADSAVPYATGIGDALAFHGHTAAAERVYTRALEADARRAPSTAVLVSRAELLRRLGRIDEAAEALEPVQTDTAAQVVVGLVAAQAGDRVLAERVAEALAAGAGPWDHGRAAYDRARIRARLGDLDAAVELLREAHAQGQNAGYLMRTDPDLAAVRDHPGYQELIRPRG